MGKIKQKESEELELKMLRAQQGVWHNKERVIIAFEGVDAAGKGGAIRRVTEKLDPRGYLVHPIGPPSPEEQGKHYLYRFWTKLPAPGTMAIFDRTWYGRVLVERVEKLTAKDRWQAAYKEINHFEKMLIDDGIRLIKIFINISKDEQLKRFEARLADPYKQWKITTEDIKAREKWDEYQTSFQDMFDICGKHAPWHIVDGDHKTRAREKVLEIITDELKDCGKWIEREANAIGKRKLADALKQLERKN